jgi:Ca2+-binding EF-hand superfamily protein
MKAMQALLAVSTVWLAGCAADLSLQTSRFEKADRNRDGLLDRAEVGSYVAGNVFDSLDKQRDGKLVSAEWNAGGSPMTAANFRKADQNADRIVTEAELSQAATQSSYIRDFFREADQNKDDAIAKREALAYYASKEGPPR